MFICPNCGHAYSLPTCGRCKTTTPCTDRIWQLTDAPDSVTDEYIGYEQIGAHYSGKRSAVVEYADRAFAQEITRVTGAGIFLDLGCGDGCLTVPAAQNGTKVIAADISNHMIRILQRKAAYHDVSLEHVLLCRMNALQLPLTDESIDCVVCNSVHLISRPERVILEIYRVLKKNGSFVFRDDQPGKTPEYPYDNSRYNEIVNSVYRMYWDECNRRHSFPKKYSWGFDRDAMCSELFHNKKEFVIPVQVEYNRKLKDGFLPRFVGRGFSDQVDVPAELHREVISSTIEHMKRIYGADFGEVSFHGIEPDMLVTVYEK